MATSPLTEGATYAFTLTATKDGTAWDLTGATVTLTLHKPDGTSLSKSATVTDGPNGKAAYTSVAADLDQTGTWYRVWKVESGSVVQYSPNPISFAVFPSP